MPDTAEQQISEPSEGTVRRFGAGAALLALVIGLLASFAAGEVVVRIAFGDKITLYPRYHTEATYGDFTIRRLRPNTTFWHTSIDGSWKFVTNAQGFRDERDYSYAKPEGVLRVLALGDSNTEGFEVQQDETYSAVLERYLSASGRPAQVYNTGVSGFGTAEELVFLRNEGLKYSPDVVVLGLMANDFEDNVKAGLFAIENGELKTVSKTHAPAVKVLDVINEVPPLRWLSENSYFYSFGFNAVWELTKAHLLRSSRDDVETEFAVATQQAGALEKDLLARLLQEIHETCRRQGILFVVADIPTPSFNKEISISSIPEGFRSIVQANCDILVHSDETTRPYRFVTAVHVPHGHQHISAIAHFILGVELGKRILDRLPQDPAELGKDVPMVLSSGTSPSGTKQTVKP